MQSRVDRLVNEELQRMSITEVLPWQLSGAVFPDIFSTKETLIYFFLPRGIANFGNDNKTNMQLKARGDYSSSQLPNKNFPIISRDILEYLGWNRSIKA